MSDSFSKLVEVLRTKSLFPELDVSGSISKSEDGNPFVRILPSPTKANILLQYTAPMFAILSQYSKSNQRPRVKGHLPRLLLQAFTYNEQLRVTWDADLAPAGKEWDQASQLGEKLTICFQRNLASGLCSGLFETEVSCADHDRTLIERVGNIVILRSRECLRLGLDREDDDCLGLDEKLSQFANRLCRSCQQWSKTVILKQETDCTDQSLELSAHGENEVQPDEDFFTTKNRSSSSGRRQKSVHERCDVCDRTFRYHKTYLRHMATAHYKVNDSSDQGRDIDAPRDNEKKEINHVNNWSGHLPVNQRKRDESISSSNSRVNDIGRAPSIANQVVSRSNVLPTSDHPSTIDQPVGSLDVDDDAAVQATDGETVNSSQDEVFRLVRKRRSKGRQVFSCEYAGCNYVAKDKTALRYHMPVHTGEALFCCVSCGKRYRYKKGMITCEKRHKGELNFSCESCQKKFISKVKLEIHSRVHTGEKPFFCPVCSYRCSRQDNLNSHTRKHHGLNVKLAERSTGISHKTGRPFGAQLSDKSDQLHQQQPLIDLDSLDLLTKIAPAEPKVNSREQMTDGPSETNTTIIQKSSDPGGVLTDTTEGRRGTAVLTSMLEGRGTAFVLAEMPPEPNRPSVSHLPAEARETAAGIFITHVPEGREANSPPLELLEDEQGINFSLTFRN